MRGFDRFGDDEVSWSFAALGRRSALPRIAVNPSLEARARPSLAASVLVSALRRPSAAKPQDSVVYGCLLEDFGGAPLPAEIASPGRPFEVK